MSVAEDIPFIVDCGCGSGRDSLFFAQHGKNVLGIDASPEAIALCRRRAVQCGLSNARFEQVNINDGIRTTQINWQIEQSLGAAPVLVYARFLLHALDDESQVAFLALAKTFSANRQGILAVEFRTHRDRFQEKVTEAHYRRYINPAHFVFQAQQIGLIPQYQIEGFGFAKYKDDDAHVYRGIFASA